MQFTACQTIYSRRDRWREAQCGVGPRLPGGHGEADDENRRISSDPSSHIGRDWILAATRLCLLPRGGYAAVLRSYSWEARLARLRSAPNAF